MVVRPDSAALLPAGIRWLWERGVRRFDPSLDVWASWDRAGLESLEAGLIRAADFWRQHLPEIGVSWFDEKAAHLLGLPIEASPRCGFGDGELAMAPSGNLYPCERLIGEDIPHPLRLPGHALAGHDFCRSSMPGRSAVDVPAAPPGNNAIRRAVATTTCERATSGGPTPCFVFSIVSACARPRGSWRRCREASAATLCRFSILPYPKPSYFRERNNPMEASDERRTQ